MAVKTYDLLEKKLKLATISLVNKTAATIIDETIQSMRVRKSGVKYSKYPNVSSAAGETPAYQSGDLARSITKKLTIHPFGATAIISVGIDYAPYLVRMGRPILTPSAKKQKMPFLINAKRILQQTIGGKVAYGNI